MIEIPHLEWHITHNCNLSCEGCMHFTNHGHNWFIDIDTLVKWYSNWNKRLSPKKMAILGGEPLLHKNLMDIIYVTRDMWKQPDNSYFELVTNGLLLDEEKHDYLPRALKDTNCVLSVSIHYTLDNEMYREKIEKSLEIIHKWKNLYDIRVCVNDMYNEWYTSYNGYGINSEPFDNKNFEESWKYCRSGQQCFQLYNGEIYKCSMTAYLGLQKQKYGHLLSKKWDPYLKYKPLESTCSDDEIVQFFNRKEEPVCGMCPAYPQTIPPVTKKNNPLIAVSHYEKINNHKFSIQYK